MKSKRIAYSLNGEGFGHYGRSIGIIKWLANHFYDYQIDVYCYYHTYAMMLKDTHLPQNVTVKKNIGMRMYYNKKGKISFAKTILFSKANFIDFFKVLNVAFFSTVINPFFRFFDKNTTVGYCYTKKYIDDFDFAVVDYEPLLPRVAKIRNKRFITVDSINLLLCGNFRGYGMNGKDWIYCQINKFLTQIEAPLSNPAIITTICDYPLRKKFQNRIIKVGPLVRKEIARLSSTVAIENFILVYIRSAVRKKIIPILKEVSNVHFVIFTDLLSEDDKKLYFADHLEFHDIDPVAFPDYFRRCRAIISTSGYTSISEAMVLKKPFFAVSIGGVLAFEQRLSLNALKNCGCGDGSTYSKFNKERLLSFLAQLNEYQKMLELRNYHDDTEHVANIIANMIETDFSKEK